jgi:hypothetical protein
LPVVIRVIQTFAVHLANEKVRIQTRCATFVLNFIPTFAVHLANEKVRIKTRR